MRILGGSQPTQSSQPTIKMYGKNVKRFKEFLYIEMYVKIITDIAAHNATIAACNSIVDQYGIDNRNNDFNYISYLYLIKNKLRALKLSCKINIQILHSKLIFFQIYIQT